jgi:hypothetical protein
MRSISKLVLTLAFLATSCSSPLIDWHTQYRSPRMEKSHGYDHTQNPENRPSDILTIMHFPFDYQNPNNKASSRYDQTESSNQSSFPDPSTEQEYHTHQSNFPTKLRIQHLLLFRDSQRQQ